MRPLGWSEEDLFLIAERAYALQMQGQYGDAITLFDGLAAIEEGNIYFRRALACLYLTVDQPSTALECISAAPLDVRNHPDMVLCKAEALIRLGRIEEARQLMDKLTQPGKLRQSVRMERRLTVATMRGNSAAPLFDN